MLNTGILGTIKPDQMQVLNPLFIIVLIPLFETVVYRLLKRPKPLKRMCAGMFLASVAFIFAGFLQMKIQVQLCNIRRFIRGYWECIESQVNLTIKQMIFLKKKP